MTNPSADDARPATAGRASAPESDQAPQAQEAPQDQAPAAGDQAANGHDGADGSQLLLRLVDIGKNFGPVRALSGITLDIPVGQVTAIVGDNGAGKSTLIKTISGIWHQDHGQILWQGRPVNLHTPKDATDLGIATVYQDLALCDNLDIVQNMFLGQEPVRHFQLDEITMEKTAKQTLADLSVVTVRSVRQPVGSLSGGQRQAVAVAKAVMRQAKLVILDEPTAALGVTQTRVVLDLIRRLKSQNIAVIVISHNLTDVRRSRTGLPCCAWAAWSPSGRRRSSTPSPIVDLMTTGTSKRLGAQPAELSHRPGSHQGAPVSTEVEEPPSEATEADEIASEAAAVAAPDVIADSLGEYAKLWLARVRGGESGALPVLLGLVAIVIYFQARSSLFLSAGNLVNLMTQAAWIVMLGMAEVWVLLLGEIDLSIGYTSAIGATFTCWLLAPPHPAPWPLAVLVGLAVPAVLRRHRGRDHHPAPAAVLRGHAGRPAAGVGPPA